MDNDYVTDRRNFRKAVAEFCRDEFTTGGSADGSTVGDHPAHDPDTAVRMAKRGLLGAMIPENYGGVGGGYREVCDLVEAISTGMARVGAYPTSIIVGFAYLKYGSQAQRKVILGGVAAGRVEALALSEPEVGSDLSSVATRAVEVDSGFVIDGRKTWVSNAHLADHLLVLVRTGPESSGSDGLTMLQVAAGTPGMTVRELRTSSPYGLNDVHFERCFVPSSAVVGMIGAGWLQVMTTLTFERLVIAAMTLGAAQRMFDDTLRYVRERRQFGTPIGKFQALRHRIAELATDLECCRLLLGRAATNGDKRGGRLLPHETAMAKLRCSETAKRMAVEGMQMMGAYGTTLSRDAERHLRDALVGTVMGGTSEIQREIIGKGLGL